MAYFNENNILYLIVVHQKDTSQVAVYDDHLTAVSKFQNLVKDSMYRHNTAVDARGASLKFCTQMGIYYATLDTYIQLYETEGGKDLTVNI